jgi:hypothetical protein
MCRECSAKTVASLCVIVGEKVHFLWKYWFVCTGAYIYYELEVIYYTSSSRRIVKLRDLRNKGIRLGPRQQHGINITEDGKPRTEVKVDNQGRRITKGGRK